MRVLVYSSKDFEIPYLTRSNHVKLDVQFTTKPLNIETAPMSNGFDCVSVFSNDDASAHVIRELNLFGIKYIAIRAAGYDNVDIHEAESLGMHVANVPEYSPYAIAEHAVAMILALNRKIVLSNAQVHQYNFTLGNLVGFDLNNKTVGLIGTGRIGGIMAGIMHGFGCKLLAHDIHPSRELQKKYDVNYCSLNELCLKSDIISIHTPLTPATRHLLNNELFSRMKKGVMIINTARGAVVKTADLIRYIKNGVIGAYGMDVYENERGIFFFNHSEQGINDPMLEELLSMKNVLITPHQAFATYEALTNIADTTFYNILEWKAKMRPENELTHASSFITYEK